LSLLNELFFALPTRQAWVVFSRSSCLAVLPYGSVFHCCCWHPPFTRTAGCAGFVREDLECGNQAAENSGWKF